MSERILIIKPSSIGDVVHSLPVLAKVRARFPGAHISWLVEESAAPVIECNAELDEVVRFRRRAGSPGKAAAEQYALARRLRAGRFDTVIDLQGLLRSALWGVATGARRRIGLGDAREGARFFYTDVAPVDGAVHAVDRYLRVGAVLGFEPGEPAFSIVAPSEAGRSARELLASTGGEPERPLVGMSPGARWPSKEWPAENFAEAGRLLQERFGGTVVLLGAKGAAAEAAKIAGGISGRVVNLVGRTSLAELVEIVGMVDIVVTPDTGTLHIADALGAPLVGVFGPTDPAKTGPYFQRRRVVAASGECREAPCMKRRCHDMICMKAIRGEDVFRRAAEVMEGVG